MTAASTPRLYRTWPLLMLAMVLLVLSLTACMTSPKVEAQPDWTITINGDDNCVIIHEEITTDASATGSPEKTTSTSTDLKGTLY